MTGKKKQNGKEDLQHQEDLKKDAAGAASTGSSTTEKDISCVQNSKSSAAQGIYATRSEKNEMFESIVSELTYMHTRKNELYGDSFGNLFERLGPESILIPLYNKYCRIESMIVNRNSGFEPIEDSLKDLASYAIMSLIEIELRKKE